MPEDLKNAEELEAELKQIVEEVEEKVHYHFCPQEVLDVLFYTVRKCQINGKGPDYIPILFENELRDYVMRLAINIAGHQNYLKKKAMEAAVNV